MTHQSDCTDPRPRISEKSGRLFCATCRAYLTPRPESAPEPPRDEEAGESTVDAADQEGD